MHGCAVSALRRLLDKQLSLLFTDWLPCVQCNDYTHTAAVLLGTRSV